MNRLLSGRTAGALILSALLAVGACDDDDPTGPGNLDVATLAVEAGAETLVEIVGQTATGSLEVDAGNETPALDVVAYDDDDEAMDLTGYALVVEVDDEDVAIFEADATEAFRGVLEGVAAGETTLVIKIVKVIAGGPGTVVYTSPEIDVTVN